MKESTTQEPDIPIVHWLHAINPDLFTKQIIQYVKNKKNTFPHIISQHTHCRQNQMCMDLQLYSVHMFM